MTVQNNAIQTSRTAAVEGIDWISVVNNELPRLYNYFRYRLGEEGVAEDLTSIVLEKSWLKRYRYHKDRAAFSVWLFSIAKNEIIGYLGKRQVSLPISMAETASGEIIEHRFEQSQDIQQLSCLLAGLSERELISADWCRFPFHTAQDRDSELAS